MAHNTLIGKQNLINLHANTSVWNKDPTTAASEIATKPVTNLNDSSPHRFWESDDATTPLTRLMKDLGTSYQLRGVNLENTNISDRGQVQVILDDRWSRRWFVDADARSIDSPNDITVTANYTFELWFRIVDMDLTSVVEIARLSLAAGGAADRDWRLNIQSTGFVEFISERLNATGDITLDGTTRVDDGAWHHVGITFNTATDLVTLYVDYVSEDTGTEVKATPSTSVAILSLNDPATDVGVHYGDARLWNTDLTLAQLVTVQAQLLIGTEIDLELCWEFGEGTSTAIADTANNHAGTCSGAVTWSTWLNPYARHNSGIVQRNGPWPTRRFVRYSGTTGEGSRTDTGLDSLFSVSVAMWFKIPSTIAAGTKVICSFGTGGTNTTYDFFLAGNNTSLVFTVARYGGSTDSLTWATDLRDDLWHTAVMAIDGVDDKMYLYVDGASHASNGQACNVADMTQVDERFTLAMFGNTGSPGRVDIAGDVVVWGKVVTPTDDKPFDRFAPESDPSIAGHYELQEGTGDEEILMSNRGSWGTSGDFTTASSGGTPDHSGFIDAQIDLPTITGEATPVYLPGVENDASRPRTFIERITSVITARYLSIDIYDPDNSDSAITIGVVGVWQSVDPTYSRQSGGSTNETIPVPLVWTPASVAVKELGTTFRNMSVRFDNLNQAEVTTLSHWVRSAIALNSPMFICLSLNNENRVYWPNRSVYGVPVGLSVDDSWWENTLYSVEVTLRELAT